jgi:hypothetical protein
MNETIKLVLTVNINYPEKKMRNEAISQAKKCALSCSILGSVGCNAKRAKLIKDK